MYTGTISDDAPMPRPATARPMISMASTPCDAVMSTPPTIKIIAATKMALLRPIFSASGNMSSEPKKQPA